MAKTPLKLKTLTYDEDDIKVVRNLEAVRKKVNYYIGPSDDYGLFTLVREPSDNVIDEWEAGRCTEMTIRIMKDGYIEIHDDGQGMPVGYNKAEKMSTFELITSNLHAGGKLDAGKGAYKNTRGTHGIGIKTNSALSTHCQYWTFREKEWHTIAFEQGVKTVEVTSLGRKPKWSAQGVVPVYDKGTIIRWQPDPVCFDKGAKLDIEMIREWAENSAYLTAGFTINLEIEGNKKPEVFYKEGGVTDWLTETISVLDCGTLSDRSIQLKGENYELVLQFTDASGIQIWAYCNGLHQTEGGNHLNVTQSLLFASLKPYFNTKANGVTREDICEGTVGLINFKIDSPKFSSQDKIKLTDTRFEELCKKEVEEGLAAFWAKNKGLAKQVVQRATDLKKVKAEFALNKAAIQDLKARSKNINKLPGKLDTVRCDSTERELFLVEGDSAAGPARGARMTKPHKFQETMALKGKPANAYKSKQDKLLASEEVLNILTAIGFDAESSDPLSKLRVGKIILLSDPDPDGYHINCLVLALLAKIIPGVYARGMVYTVVSPKYILQYKGEQYFGLTLDEIRKAVPKDWNAERNPATYLKGWGEIDDQYAMRAIAFDPSTRRLVKIDAPSKKDMEEFAMLMGEDVDYRRELLGIGSTGE